ncbi:DUF429 domain-containing protein [Undibacterium curvum]|uniref:DUF429 domain-containing protein n=1 Tax=Undibacterium curvum TaxID=2762294 RepID=UPI003D147F5F
MTLLHGIDFTSAPSRRKGVTIATAVAQDGMLALSGLTTLHSLAEFSVWLQQQEYCVAAFDLPFSLPRELIGQQGWPQHWPALIAELSTLSRAGLREVCKAFCDARPAGNKFAHRATDRPAGSSPSMKWVNPPVAYMLHAGMPLIVQAGFSVPGMHLAQSHKIALEAYPGMVARSITRLSYKSDDKAKQDASRTEQRSRIIAAIETGATPWQTPLQLGQWRDAILADGSADLLDAVLCLLLAGWAWQRREQQFGLPAFDALEGWIVGCELAAI